MDKEIVDEFAKILKTESKIEFINFNFASST
ncbi:hypothetical protein [Mycoplasmopsis bovis]